MCKPVLILGAFAVLFIATAYSQQFKIIYPTYRPPRQPHYPIIRTAREAGDEPLLGNDDQLPEERPMLPLLSNMDLSKRHVRSLGTPSSSTGRASGSSKSSRGHDTGPTHPGYNRRNAREVKGDFIRRPSTKDSKVPSMYSDVNLVPSAPQAGSTSAPVVFVKVENRRQTRSLHLPTLPPFNPRPIRPWNPPTFPLPGPERPRFPIYA